MKNKNQKGFNLVELIVVLVILSVISAIAFMSISKWIGNSRDSRRKSDISILTSGFDIFKSSHSIYPDPDDYTIVKDNNGAIGWYQGSIKEGVKNFLSLLKKVPKDPQGDYYGYSITADKKTYQLMALTENGEQLISFSDKVYAATRYGYFQGNYDGYFIASTGGLYYLYQAPTLFVDSDYLSGFLLGTGSKPLLQKNTDISQMYNIRAVNVTDLFDSDGTNDLSVLNLVVSTFSGVDSNIADIATASRIVRDSPGANGITSVSLSADCTFSGTTVLHGNSVTAYSESNIVWNAAYDCTARSETRTCNNGTLSGSYTYPNCVKGTPTNCAATGTYLYNTHTYSIPGINHATTGGNILSTNVTENNGTFQYTLTSIECNDGVLINPVENPTPSVVSCNSGYYQSSNTCIAYVNGVCTSLPSNAWYYNSTTSYSLSNAPNGTTLVATTAGYNASPTSNTCQYKCASGYTWDGSACVVPINGSCGTVSNTIVSSQPATNLCASGTPSLLTYDVPMGEYIWTCNGSGGGSNASCKAYDNKTVLLMHMNGTDNGTSFTDELGKTVTRNGDTNTKTATKKFGTASAYFDGAGDYISLPTSTDWNFGTSDFTIDGWIYQTSCAQLLFANQSAVNVLTLYCSRVIINGVDSIVGISIPNGQWVHYALVRNGNSMKVYINGVQSGNTADVTGISIGSSSVNSVGGYSGGHFYNGYIDELRVSKGIARWTGDFNSSLPNREYSLAASQNYFAGAGTSGDPYRIVGESASATSVVATSCNYYNLNATTLNYGSVRGTGSCGNGSQACLADGIYRINPQGGTNAFNVYCDMSTDLGGWTLLHVYNSANVGSSFYSNTVFSSDNNLPLSPTGSTGTHNWNKFSTLVNSSTLLRYTNNKNSVKRYEKNLTWSSFTSAPSVCSSINILGGDNNGTKVDSTWNGSFATNARGNGYAYNGIRRGPYCLGGSTDAEGLGLRYLLLNGGSATIGSSGYDASSNTVIVQISLK